MLIFFQIQFATTTTRQQHSTFSITKLKKTIFFCHWRSHFYRKFVSAHDEFQERQRLCRKFQQKVLKENKICENSLKDNHQQTFWQNGGSHAGQTSGPVDEVIPQSEADSSSARSQCQNSRWRSHWSQAAKIAGRHA